MAYLGKRGGPKISVILRRQGYRGTGFIRNVPCGQGGPEASFKSLIAAEEANEKRGKVRPVLINQGKHHGKGAMYVSFQDSRGFSYDCSIHLTRKELKQLGDNYKRIEINYNNIPSPCPVRDDAWG